MNTIFIIEELWMDRLENHPSYARGYRQAGYVDTRAEAEKLISDAGVEVGTGWPLLKGEKMPRKRVKPLDKLT